MWELGRLIVGLTYFKIKHSESIQPRLKTSSPGVGLTRVEQIHHLPFSSVDTFINMTQVILILAFLLNGHQGHAYFLTLADAN